MALSPPRLVFVDVVVDVVENHENLFDPRLPLTTSRGFLREVLVLNENKSI
jgi:hypothetical protein